MILYTLQIQVLGEFFEWRICYFSNLISSIFELELNNIIKKMRTNWTYSVFLLLLFEFY